MNLTTENIVLIGSLLLFMSVLAGKTSYKFGVPTLLLFLTIGMLAGSDGPGGIHFDNPKIAQFIGVVSLNFILFSGGLDTQWNSIKPILREGLILSTLGVFLTAISLGLFVWWVTDLSLFESLLLGSIVSSTDAAAVFSILRSQSMSLQSNLRPMLELESGSNDPMAYVLTIAFLSLVMQPDQPLLYLIGLLFQQMFLGVVLGLGFGKISHFIINKINLDYEGLYIVLVISLMFITFSATDFVGGNGFLAIYICAVYLGNQDLIHKKTIFKMYDGLAWLMQIVLFLTLGLLVFPKQIVPYIGVGLLISSFLIIVARPLSVFISLLPFRIPIRQKLYVSWVGLRGAVPIVFSTYPLLAGIEHAMMIFDIVFFISLTSVIIQGTTLPIVARWLRVALPEKTNTLSEIERFISEIPKSSLQEFPILPGFAASNKRIVDLKFPKSAFIIMIKREGQYIRPGGSTVIEANDLLMVLADHPDDFECVRTCLQGSPSDAASVA